MELNELVTHIKLYHFTDKRNLESIVKLGGLYSYAKLKEKGIKFYGGGNKWSVDADARSGMDQFVHCCLARKHPMEYRARSEGRICESVFLGIDAKVLLIEGVQYSCDVSNKAGVEILEMVDAKDRIDLKALYSYTDWSVPANQTRRAAAEKCEVLVPDMVKMKYLHLPNG